MVGSELGCGQKAHHTVDLDHKTPLVGLQDLSGKDFSFLHLLFQLVPDHVHAGFLEGHLHESVLVLQIHHGGRDGVAGLEVFESAQTAQNSFTIAINRSCPYRAEIDIGYVAPDFDDSSCQDVAFFGKFRRVLVAEQLLHLAYGGRFSGIYHVKNTPFFLRFSETKADRYKTVSFETEFNISIIHDFHVVKEWRVCYNLIVKTARKS